VYNS